MVVHVQKVGNEFVLPPQAVQELGLVDGSAIEVSRAEDAPVPTVRYASVDEVMEIHRKMESRHAIAYTELAK